MAIFGPPYFLDVFYPIMNFGHFGASLAFDLPECQEPWRQGELTGNGTKNKRKQHRGKPRQTEIKQQRKTLGAGQKQYSPCFFGENVVFHKNTAYARLGV